MTGPRAPSTKVTIDIGPLLETNWTGIPVFTRRLVQALIRDGRLDLAFMWRMTPIPPPVVLAAIEASTGVGLRDFYALRAPAIDIVPDIESCLFYPMVKEMGGAATREASTVHDITTLTMPECHSVANVDYHLDHLAEQLRTDERVFCISQTTRAALAAAFPSAAWKMVMLPQYVDWPERFEDMDRNATTLGLGPYALVIGTIELRKNLNILARTLAAGRLSDSPLRFVIVGAEGLDAEKLMAELPDAARERLLFAGFVSEFTKYRLIRGAQFVVFPSLYEGFGIPALEAMSLGKPVLASWSGSLPEVIGDAGVYFDPLSVDAFVEGLKEIAHPARLAELAPIAHAASAAYTWQRMADPVVDWVTGR